MPKLGPRGADFSFSCLKIHVFGHKLDTLCLQKHGLRRENEKSTSRGPDFSFLRLKIHVFGHILDTLCSRGA